MTEHYFKANSYTFAFANQEECRHLLISGFTGSDGSAYLNINSGAEINYSKFSYHPKEKRFQYAFTDEIWKALDKLGKGKPNNEKIKSLIINVNPNQLLCEILIDRSALFMKGIPKDREVIFDFPKSKILLISFGLESDIPIVTHKFVKIPNEWESEVRVLKERVYLQSPTLKTDVVTGVGQFMDDSKLPWKMLCIGM